MKLRRCIKVPPVGFAGHPFSLVKLRLFPRNRNMSTADPDTAESSARDHRALILVVERNPVVQRLERYFLEQAGYTVEFAADGKSALERARELRPRIVRH